MSDYPGMFTPKEIADFPADGFEAGEIVNKRWLSFLNANKHSTLKGSRYDQYMAWSGFATVFVNRYADIYAKTMLSEKIVPNRKKNVTNVESRLEQIGSISRDALEVSRSKKASKDHATLFAKAMAQQVAYEFTDDEYERMQVLMRELHRLITKSEDIEPNHKKRLLERLAQLHSDLHKVMSDIDRPFGVLVEIIYSLKDKAETIKPILDVTESMSKIIVAVVASAGASYLTLSGNFRLPPANENVTQNQSSLVDATIENTPNQQSLPTASEEATQVQASGEMDAESK